MTITFMTLDDYTLGGVTNYAQALSDSAASGQPVYGLANMTPYSIASQITLPEGAQVICLPGCGFSYSAVPAGGLIACPPPAPPVRALPRLWQGGTFVPVGTPTGDIFAVTDSQVTIRDVTLTGVRQGAGIRVGADRASIINVRVSGTGPGALGVVVRRGTEFRLRDGAIDVTSDAIAIQPSISGDAVSDAQIEGIHCTSSGGSLLAIRTGSGDIAGVAVRGLTGECSGTGPAIGIGHLAGTTGTPRIADVFLSDVRITHQAANSDALGIVSLLNGDDGLISNIRLDNVRLVHPSGAYNSSYAMFSATASGSSRIVGVSWFAGGIAVEGADPTFAHRLIDISGVKDAVFSGLRLSGSAAARPVRVGTNGACESVVFTDVRLTGLDAIGSTITAVSFDQATHCGWTRGAIAGVAGANFTAVSVTASSSGCYVDGAELGDPTTNAALPAGAISLPPAPAIPTTRLQDNFGSTQRSASTFGSSVGVVLSGTTITVGATNVRVTTGGSLSTINGGAEVTCWCSRPPVR